MVSNLLLWKLQVKVEKKWIWDLVLCIHCRQMGTRDHTLAYKFNVHFSTCLHGFLSVREVKTLANTVYLLRALSGNLDSAQQIGNPDFEALEMKKLSHQIMEPVWCLLGWLLGGCAVPSETTGRCGCAGSALPEGRPKPLPGLHI